MDTNLISGRIPDFPSHTRYPAKQVTQFNILPDTGYPAGVDTEFDIWQDTWYSVGYQISGQAGYSIYYQARLRISGQGVYCIQYRAGYLILRRISAIRPSRYSVSNIGAIIGYDKGRIFGYPVERSFLVAKSEEQQLTKKHLFANTVSA